MLEHWMLDPDCTYLNHGTVGATPRRVLEKQQGLRDEMERQPSRFVLRELGGYMPMPWRSASRLREASDQVAAFVGARPDDLVFVPNVTTGLNAVLQSLALAGGDEIVITDLAYGAVAYAAAAVCERSGASVRTVCIRYPVTDPGDVVKAVVTAITPRTKAVIIDHVTAQTSLVLPVQRIAADCHVRGVPVLVDGAHAPGSRRLDVPSLGADWYSANLHKWAHAPRGCGFLWASAERQSMLHFPVVYWGVIKASARNSSTPPPPIRRVFSRRPKASLCCANGTSTRACTTCTRSPGRRPAGSRIVGARRSTSRVKWSAR